MNRRAFIGGVGLGIASVPFLYQLVSSRNASGGFPDVTVESDAVSRSDVLMSVEVVRQFTDSHPARIRVTFKNESDSEMTFSFGNTPPFSEYVSTGDGPRLVVIPVSQAPGLVVGEVGSGTTTGPDGQSAEAKTRTARTETDPSDGGDDETTEAAAMTSGIIPTEQRDRCWSLPAGELAVYGRQVEKTIPPGETINEEYAVLNHPENDGCLPTGEYRFVAERYFGDDAPWSFAVKLA